MAITNPETISQSFANDIVDIPELHGGEAPEYDWQISVSTEFAIIECDNRSRLNWNLSPIADISPEF